MKRVALISVAASALCAAHMASAATHYVDLSNAMSAPPYTNWAAAATNIQDAVDATVAGDEIVVTNGLYATGGRAVYGTLTNRVAINKAVTVRSVNGPLLTFIQGLGVGSGATNNGDGAIRCVYVGTNAVLSGFTLTNGHTRTAGDYHTEQSGGGTSCEVSGVVSNCILSGNLASYFGGGGYSGTLNNCTLVGNSASGTYGAGGGAYSSTLNNCTLSGNSVRTSGGGAYGSTLNNCTLSGNSASGYGGGGAASSTLKNCALSSNSAFLSGGGVWNATLNNCILSGNSAGSDGGAYASTLNNCTVSGNWATNSAGGVGECTLNNCIVYYNSAPANSNYYGGPLNYCCTTLPPPGYGNITNEPLFMNTNGWSDLRLQANSPCINSGRNAYAPGLTDLNGNPRISGGTVDMGAYEFQNPASMISYAWLRSYGLPTNGSADYADPDADGMNNFQEWVAGTNPTNAASVLRMLSPVPSPSSVLVTWSSVSNRTYSLGRATNLGTVPAFSVLWSNIAGLTGTTSLTDTNPPAGTAAFYRVAVQPP